MKPMYILLPLLLLPGIVFSAGKISDDKKLIYQDLADGYVRCSAYFSVSEKAIKNSNDSKMAKSYGEYSKKLYKLSNKFATITKSKKQAKKSTRSSYKSYKEDMLNEVNHNGNNISTLMDKHMDFCKVAMSSPSEFVNLILDNQQKK